MIIISERFRSKLRKTKLLFKKEKEIQIDRDAIIIHSEESQKSVFTRKLDEKYEMMSMIKEGQISISN